ncbi:hypothetical protein [Helicobacter rodentium]|uniref:hypothetical protein n=1 Tax=Helicobacter rodentium TaxID=59617 RepID=UPI00047A992B|nr:hypothetical protein [Helicobacter rodentium]
MGGKVYAKDCPLRHCEAHAMLPSLLSPPQLRHCEIPLTDYFVIARKFEKFSWQSIILSISKDSIVKIFCMQDYGLLRLFHSLAMT